MHLGYYVFCLCCVVCFSDCSDNKNTNKACKPPFHRFANSCYYISRDQVWGDEAFARCINIGGYLANFETLEEAMLMKQKLKKMNSGLHFFVGGRNINRRKAGGDWRWIKNGTMIKMSYFAFGNGEPNGIDSNTQDCMFFFAGEHYRFHSVFCDNYNGGYICEK
uniref:C-type lectin domain-containing protein n=1 Tax=Magallana gigas TaxID=29159 RepID=A0A8W8L967_MAGGI|nr:perlucin-like protein [Crassostrea gigas]